MRRTHVREVLWRIAFGVLVIVLGMFSLYQLLSTSPKADWELVAVVVLCLASIALTLLWLVKFQRLCWIVLPWSLLEIGRLLSGLADISELLGIIFFLAVLIWEESVRPSGLL